MRKALSWAGVTLVHLALAGLFWRATGYVVAPPSKAIERAVLVLTPISQPRKMPDALAPRQAVSSERLPRRAKTRSAQPIAAPDTETPLGNLHPLAVGEGGQVEASTERFDRATALRTARGFAAEVRARPGNALAQEESLEQRLGKSIEKSARSDCRNAYAGAGLLALPMLAKDALSEKGCKW